MLHANLAVVFEESFRTPLNSLVLETHLKMHLTDVMHDLLDMGTHLSALKLVTEGWWFWPVSTMCLSNPKYVFNAPRFGTEHMEMAIDSMCSTTPDLTSFILHTGDILTAYVHVARASCRAAEAAVVAYLNTASGIEVRDQPLLSYLNRLSDYLFALARLCTHVQEGLETTHG
jgi:cob(I)alamin adenosyltransferase